MRLRDLDTFLAPFEARNRAARRLEQLRELQQATDLEIKLIAIVRDETGTTARAAEMSFTPEEARDVLEAATGSVRQSLENANKNLEDLGVEMKE